MNNFNKLFTTLSFVAALQFAFRVTAQDSESNLTARIKVDPSKAIPMNLSGFTG